MNRQRKIKGIDWNRGLGLFKEDIDSLSKAIDYLKEYANAR